LFFFGTNLSPHRAGVFSFSHKRRIFLARRAPPGGSPPQTCSLPVNEVTQAKAWIAVRHSSRRAHRTLRRKSSAGTQPAIFLQHHNTMIRVAPHRRIEEVRNGNRRNRDGRFDRALPVPAGAGPDVLTR
jgi:hypothetical protein